MKTETLRSMTIKLKGLNWFAFSGFAAEVYSNGERKAGDLDIVLHEGDLYVFAERIGCKAGRRKIDKKTFVVEDYGFETNFNGQEIEGTNGYPIKRVQEGTFNKLFDRKVKRIYQGVEVFLAPLEEIIVGKAYMAREKDIKDLQLFREVELDISFLHTLARDWGKYENTIKVLKERGYKVD